MGAVVILGACGSPDRRSATPATGHDTGHYKIGLPYKIDGTTYYPAVDYDYAETGIASWYGSKFHGRRTANGEIFDMNAISAAHRTLPMPSMVRVTNLDNGRTLAVRVNDRGPFVDSKSRIIDLSRRAAQVLGFRTKGLSRVKVEIMAAQSRRMAAGREGTRPSEDLAIIRDPRPVRTASIEASPLARIAPPTQTDGAPAAGVDGSTRYYVQAGAFRNYANAVGLQSWLASMGKVSIVASDSAMPVYRVRIGPYADAAAARALLDTILVERRPDAWVVSD